MAKKKTNLTLLKALTEHRMLESWEQENIQIAVTEIRRLRREVAAAQFLRGVRQAHGGDWEGALDERSGVP